MFFAIWENLKISFANVPYVQYSIRQNPNLRLQEIKLFIWENNFCCWYITFEKEIEMSPNIMVCQKLYVDEGPSWFDCYILLHIVTYCYILLHIVTYCYILLHIVTYCYILLHIVTYCCILLHIVTYCYILLHIVAYCYILLHIVTYCYILLHIVTHCYILLHIVTYCYLVFTSISFI